MQLEWKKTSETSARVGFRKLLHKEFLLPNGQTSTFDIYDEGESVSILALTVDDMVVVAKQFRPGPELVVLDLPCGAIEKGETPLNAAARELVEETGYAGKLVEVGTCLEQAQTQLYRDLLSKGPGTSAR